MKEELTEDQKKWMEYLNQFIKESGRGPRGFFVKLKTGEYLELEEYNKWIVEMKDKYKNS